MVSLTVTCEPVCGWLHDGGDSAQFDGWLELLALLRRVADGAGLGRGQDSGKGASKSRQGPLGY